MSHGGNADGEPCDALLGQGRIEHTFSACAMLHIGVALHCPKTWLSPNSSDKPMVHLNTPPKATSSPKMTAVSSFIRAILLSHFSTAETGPGEMDKRTSLRRARLGTCSFCESHDQQSACHRGRRHRSTVYRVYGDKSRELYAERPSWKSKVDARRLVGARPQTRWTADGEEPSEVEFKTRIMFEKAHSGPTFSTNFLPRKRATSFGGENMVVRKTEAESQIRWSYALSPGHRHCHRPSHEARRFLHTSSRR